MAKLYRVYKHFEREYNFLTIEVISGEKYYEPRRIFHIKWQQTAGETQYYGFRYHFSGRNELMLFTKIVKQIEKTKQVDYDIQPWTMIQILENLGYRQCEYYDSIGFTECEKVENPNNLVYSMYSNGNLWTTRLANKRNYKTQIKKKSGYSNENTYELTFEVSKLNDKIKNTKKYDIESLHREYIMYYGNEEEKKHYLRQEKLERILQDD